MRSDGRLEVLQRVRILYGNAQQRLCRTGRPEATPFPLLLVGAHRHSEQIGEFGLRHADLGTGDGRLRQIQARDARGLRSFISRTLRSRSAWNCSRSLSIRCPHQFHSLLHLSHQPISFSWMKAFDLVGQSTHTGQIGLQ